MSTILIVDDKPDNRYLLQAVLTGNGFEVLSAADGRAALVLARQAPPDLTIADILMPGMDGFALCREWRRDPALRRIPFVFYTATYTDPKDERLALDVGADLFLVKPLEPDVLVDRIRRVLDERAAGRSPAPAASPESETVVLQEYNQALVRKLEAKLAELDTALRQRAELERIVSLSPATVWLWRNAAGWPVEFVSDNVARLGYDPEDFRAGRLDFSAIIHPDDRARVSDEAARYSAESGRDSFAQEYRLLTADGQARHIDDRRWIQRDETGAITHYHGILVDITERKQAESQREAALEALTRERSLLRTLIDALPDHIFVKDREGRMILVNEAQARDIGLSRPDEAIGKTDFELVSADLAVQYHEAEQSVIQLGQSVALEERFVTPTGEKRTVSTIKAPLRDTHGDIVGLVGMSRDITEHKRLEEQFLQAQKMEMVGRLAGGVAHDFNNLLTAIGGYAGFVKAALPPDSHARDDIDQVIRAGERAAQLTRQLLSFSRRQIIAPQVIDLNQLVLETDKMLRRLIGEDIESVTVPGRDLGAVKVDPGQVEQVLVNLAVNARDAMPNGGRLTVETANVTLDADYARLHLGTVAGEYVMLAVSDTGTGMTEEVQAHVFEPFFTTKEKGKGTGLGLATVYGIVQQHGGNIWVYSEPGRGTTFKIYLPRVDATAADGKLRPTEATWLPRGTETILVVEDEPIVRDIAVQGLTELGYTVLEAANGGEALQVVRNHDGPIDLLLTDVVMPRMSGQELAVRLTDICPDVPVLYMSGYTDNAIVHQGTLDEGLAFLQKPFTTVALARKVHEVLHGKRGV